MFQMIDVGAYPSHPVFSSVLIRSPSPVPDSYNSQDLFNPVYEELSNGSVERGESDSEGMPQAPVSEDEFAEDELSIGGDTKPRPDIGRRSGSSSLEGSTGNDLCKDVDFSDVDDRCRFLEDTERSFPLPSAYRDQERKIPREQHIHHPSSERKSLDRRRRGRNKGPSLPAPPPECSDFHEGLLLKTLLQFCPNPTGVESYGHRPLCPERSMETFPSFAHSHHPKQEVFTTFRAGKGSGPKNPSQESSFGSDSGYSNNTSGGKTSNRSRRDCRISNNGDFVLS